MMCSNGTTEPTDAIFIPDHPLPLFGSRRAAGCGSNQTKEILSAKQLVSAHDVRVRAKTYAQAVNEKPEET